MYNMFYYLRTRVVDPAGLPAGALCVCDALHARVGGGVADRGRACALGGYGGVALDAGVGRSVAGRGGARALRVLGALDAPVGRRVTDRGGGQSSALSCGLAF